MCDFHGHIADQVRGVAVGNAVFGEDISSPLNVVLLFPIVPYLQVVNSPSLDFYRSTPVLSGHFKEVVPHDEHNHWLVILGAYRAQLSTNHEEGACGEKSYPA